MSLRSALSLAWHRFRIVGNVLALHPMRRAEHARDPFGKRLPWWMAHIAIGGFREQGWAAYDQRQGGKQVAAGAWGESILLLRSGKVSTLRQLASQPDDKGVE